MRYEGSVSKYSGWWSPEKTTGHYKASSHILNAEKCIWIHKTDLRTVSRLPTTGAANDRQKRCDLVIIQLNDIMNI